MNSNKLLAAS